MKKKHELIYEPAFYIFKVTVGKKRTKVLFNYVGNQQTASFFFPFFLETWVAFAFWPLSSQTLGLLHK